MEVIVQNAMDMVINQLQHSIQQEGRRTRAVLSQDINALRAGQAEILTRIRLLEWTSDSIRQEITEVNQEITEIQTTVNSINGRLSAADWPGYGVDRQLRTAGQALEDQHDIV
jgi:uncharacterized protein YicC (UPF0701 family)